jgi:hypothetical protein
MSKGHLIFAQNSDYDYVKQAYALALTIKKHNQINSVCLVTNDIVPDSYKHVFDYIVGIPFDDESQNSLWKIENRWKLFHASPFEETMVYDSDMLLFDSNDSWWKYFKDKDVVLTNSVLDYRGNVIHDVFLRKAFTQNDLPNVYFGFHYFRKTDRAYQFYKCLKQIVKNWKKMYDIYTPVSTQRFCSMDISAAIATKMLGAENEFVMPSYFPTFVHMKKELQSWSSFSNSWRKSVIINFDIHGRLKISNYLQSTLFHYTEPEFLTDDVIKILENYE